MGLLYCGKMLEFEADFAVSPKTHEKALVNDNLEGWSGLVELVFCGLRKHSQLSSMDWMVVGYYAVLLPAAEGKYVVG